MALSKQGCVSDWPLDQLSRPTHFGVADLCRVVARVERTSVMQQHRRQLVQALRAGLQFLDVGCHVQSGGKAKGPCQLSGDPSEIETVEAATANEHTSLVQSHEGLALELRQKGENHTA